MKSIRNKLFLQMGLLITLLIGVLILVNSFFLEPYYMYQVRQKMLTVYDQVNQMDASSFTEESTALYQIEGDNDVDIIITEAEGNLIYATNTAAFGIGNRNVVDDRLPHRPEPDLPKDESKEVGMRELSRTAVDGNLEFRLVMEPNFNLEHQLLMGTMDNGLILELRVAVQTIQTSVELTNQILIFIGITFFVLALGFAYLLSSSFTKPILAMNAATKDIKALNFDSRCVVEADDELGELAESINQMSETLSETIQALHIKDERRRTLLNNVSHELKTPLTLMQGYGVALQKNLSKDPDKTAFYCEVIIDETEKMSQLVETLLDIDQIELDQTKLQKRSFEINGFVSEVFKKFEDMMAKEGIDCQLELTNPVHVACDMLLTERVLKNYLSNAIHYVTEPKVICLKVLEKEAGVRVEVCNTAAHFTEEDMEKIWESFYKMDKARSRERGGHGLGLSIVKAIQEAHEQPFGVENRDEGVCFWFQVARSL